MKNIKFKGDSGEWSSKLTLNIQGQDRRSSPEKCQHHSNMILTSDLWYKNNTCGLLVAKVQVSELVVFLFDQMNAASRLMFN